MQVMEITGRPPENSEPMVMAIGKFDGIHIGHQTILRVAKSFVADGLLAVMSFWPHPMWALAQKQGYDKYLTPFAEKFRLLEAYGVDRLYHVHFSREYASTSAEDFVKDHLVALGVRRVVVGFDFRFGRGGTADVRDLQRLCDEVGIPVTIVPPVEENGLKVSSSQIREHLSYGRVEAVEALLGRPYTIVGSVVHGQQVGHTIGFPTANLGDLDEFVLPASGVYAVSVEILESEKRSGRNWFGVMNAGVRPTVNGTSFRLEVHVLGFEGNLYGARLRVSFLRRVRDEQKFSSLDQLKQQIASDIQYAKRVFGQQ